MECPNLREVKFSQVSLDAIEDIRRVRGASEKLIIAIGAGHVANIFLGNSKLESTYSLYSTDFELMSGAMQAVPLILRRRISDIADMTYLNVSNHKEKQFWRAVSSGCSVQ